MGIPAPMCSFAALYLRVSPPTKGDTRFLGLYVHIEPVKKDFFRRRDGLKNVPSGSLYEFEAGDDFTSPKITQQLHVEWPATGNPDFMFARDRLLSPSPTTLEKTVDLPSFIRFWATEIFLKSWDGYTGNQNNTYVFDGPPALPITKTNFRFIPHGLDQVLATTRNLEVYKKSIVAELAYKDNGLRYQLIRTLATMGDQMERANVPGHVDSFVPLVVRLWQGQDPFFGDIAQPFGVDRNQAMQMAEKVRLAAQQAIVDLRTMFGYGLVTPVTDTPIRLVGTHHAQCVDRGPTSSVVVGRAPCMNLPVQQWKFEPAAKSMTNLGFQEPLKLYRVRSQASPHCLTVGAPFVRKVREQHREVEVVYHKLQLATCDPNNDGQRLFLVQREGGRFELRAFTEDRCAHFSDSEVTDDGRPAIYLGSCDRHSKNLIAMENSPN